MLTEDWFALLVLLVGGQRLRELRISKRNERELRRLGAREHAPGQMPLMTALHALWLVSMLLEVEVLHPQPIPWLSWLAAGVFLTGQALRIGAMRALGGRWCVRILTLPGRAPVNGGIFRYLRHPNYLGVVLELAALPLVHFAFRTAIVFSIANALLLHRRILAEERALEQDGYEEALTGRPRLWPRWGAGGAP